MVLSRSPKFIQSCLDCTTLSVTQYHDKLGAEPLRGELHAADLRRGNDVSSNADDEQVTETLVENDFYGDAGVGTTEDDGKRFLSNSRLTAVLLIHEGVGAAAVQHEAFVTNLKTFDGFYC